jgi:hypothetical protein
VRLTNSLGKAPGKKIEHGSHGAPKEIKVLISTSTRAHPNLPRPFVKSPGDMLISTRKTRGHPFLETQANTHAQISLCNRGDRDSRSRADYFLSVNSARLAKRTSGPHTESIAA